MGNSNWAWAYRLLGVGVSARGERVRVKALVSVCALMGVEAMLCGAQAPESLTGKWQVTAVFYGTQTYAPLQLEQSGEKLKGTFHGQKLEGTVDAGKVHFVAKYD